MNSANLIDLENFVKITDDTLNNFKLIKQGKQTNNFEPILYSQYK